MTDHYVKRNEQKIMNNVRMNLQERIIHLLETSGKSQSDLARFLGISRATVSDWKSGKIKSLSSENAFKAGQFFNVNPEWLATGKGSVDNYIEGQVIRQALPGHQESNAYPAPMLGKSRQVPIVGTAQLGDNGHWTELDYPVGFGDGFINYPTADANAYALRCTGDSMRPRIRDGEFVIIEPNSEPIPGDEVLVKAVDGRVMIKILLYQRDDRVYLMSINEAHPPQSFALTEIDKIHPVVAIVKKSLWAKSD